MRATTLLTLVLAAANAIRPSGAELEREGDDRAVQQLLVETILANRPAWHGYTADTFCVALGPLEWKHGLLVPPVGPSDLFLSRIATNGMSVLPARGCQMISMGIDAPGVVTVSGRKPAFFITVSDVSHASPETAEARAGFVCGAMCAWGVTYVLERREAGWVIRDRRDLVIS